MDVEISPTINPEQIQSLEEAGEKIEGRIVFLDFKLEPLEYVLGQGYPSDCLGIISINHKIKRLFEGQIIEVLLDLGGETIWEVKKGDEIYVWGDEGKCTTSEQIEPKIKRGYSYIHSLIRIGYALEDVKVNSDVYVKVYVKIGKRIDLLDQGNHIRRVVV